MGLGADSSAWPWTAFPNSSYLPGCWEQACGQSPALQRLPGKGGESQELQFQQHCARAPAAAAGQKVTQPQHVPSTDIPVSPSMCPASSKTKQVPGTHFSCLVLPQMQTSLRLWVKAGLQHTAKVPMQDQQHPSLLRESAQISPHPHLICHFSCIRAEPSAPKPAQFP